MRRRSVATVWNPGDSKQSCDSDNAANDRTGEFLANSELDNFEAVDNFADTSASAGAITWVAYGAR